MSDKILVIDDDEALADMIAEYLGGAGLTVDCRYTAEQGMSALEAGGYDALVLDVMLPDLDGFEVCRRVRAQVDTPILMLTARGEDTDRIVGLELGADDYLPKPFNPRELLARLRAILRRGSARFPRAPGARKARLHYGRLEIDRDRREVLVDGEKKILTGHQFDLLWALAENAGRVMSRDALMNRIRGRSAEAYDRSIDVHISRIRAAIEDEPKHPRRLVTVRGAGYVFARSQD